MAIEYHTSHGVLLETRIVVRVVLLIVELFKLLLSRVVVESCCRRVVNAESLTCIAAVKGYERRYRHH